MKYTKKNKLLAKSTAMISALLYLFMFSLSWQSHAEENKLEQNVQELPSLGGKLNLTPQKQEENSVQNDEQNKNTGEEQINITSQKEQNKKIQTKREDVILHPGHSQNSVIMQEDGSNVIIVHGSNKAPENYSNSTHVNNGFYMNITNPDGSGMNMGTYFNSNSSSNSPRKRSSAQIIVDKME